MAHTHGHCHGHGHGHHESGPDLLDLLDLDGDVLASYFDEATAWIETHLDAAPRRILDLGCGTGSGTFALLRRFPEAQVTAMDVDEESLARLLRKAAVRGVSDHVTTLQADADAAWPDLDGFDLAWASASIHHMADPALVLRRTLGSLREGGMLAVLEIDRFPRFLPDAVGDGLEERLHSALGSQAREDMPDLGADWGPKLTEAGFELSASQPFEIDLPRPLPDDTARYAQLSLSRTRRGVVELATEQDLALLDRLIDDDGPESVLRRDDLGVRTNRYGWLGVRA